MFRETGLPDKDDRLLFDDGGECSFLEEVGDDAPKTDADPAGGETKLTHGLFEPFRWRLEVDVDLVLAIDCTRSMEKRLEPIRRFAGDCPYMLAESFDMKGRSIHSLRIKVIAFRDYYHAGESPAYTPMEESRFFVLPDDLEEYEAFLAGLTAVGGGDEPESALEALHFAFNSDWLADPEFKKRRQIVMLFTDAEAHPLDDPRRHDPEYSAGYPEGVPESLEALYEEYMSPEVFSCAPDDYPRGHRLCICAPYTYPWGCQEDSVACWYDTLYVPLGETWDEKYREELKNAFFSFAVGAL